jgi:hypothetical protein
MKKHNQEALSVKYPRKARRMDRAQRNPSPLLQCSVASMTNYRRNFSSGRSFFFSDAMVRRKMMGFASLYPSHELINGALWVKPLSCLLPPFPAALKIKIRSPLRRPCNSTIFCISSRALDCAIWPPAHAAFRRFGRTARSRTRKNPHEYAISAGP